MTTHELAIEAYNTIIQAQDYHRRYAEFRYYFVDKNDNTVPVTPGRGILQRPDDEGPSGNIRECIPERVALCGPILRKLCRRGDTEVSAAGRSQRV